MWVVRPAFGLKVRFIGPSTYEKTTHLDEHVSAGAYCAGKA